ncbi:ATP-binding protein [Prosthecomicrobium sp. N25]|uniref:ATP-binding protein n=1 Tax=Prosthecomicrobium sp. N25 TaxID=3129254 RepID=UPI0030774F52
MASEAAAPSAGLPAGSVGPAGRESAWARLLRRLPIGWRIFLIVAINAIGILVFGLLIWRGSIDITSSWNELNRIRGYERLLVEVDTEAGRLQSLIHRYFNRPTPDVLAEIVRRQDELLSRLRGARVAESDIAAELNAVAEITTRFLVGFDALRDVNVRIRSVYETEFLKAATDMAGLYAIIDSATDNNKSLIWPALGKSRESFSQTLVDANAYYLSRNPESLKSAREHLATIERTIPVMVDLSEAPLQRQALARLVPRAAALRVSLEKLAASFDQQSRFLVAAIDGNQAAMAATIDRLSIRIRGRESAAQAQFDNALVTVTQRYFLVGLAFLAVSLLASWAVARSILQPLQELGSTMRAIVEGDYERIIRGLAARDEIGAMARAVEVFRENVIAKRHVELEREAQERRWRGILETSPIGISIVSAEGGHRLYANRKYEALFGLGDDRADVRRLFHESFANAADAVRLSDAVKRHGLVSGWEVRMRRTGGQAWWCLMEVRPIEFDGRPAHIFWHYDVTDRRRAEDELRAAKEAAETALAELREAQENLVEAEKLAAIGGLVAGVAHEVNNPVGISLTVASTLDRRSEAFEAELETGALRKSRLMEFVGGVREAAGQLVSNLSRAGELVQSFKQVAVDRTHADRRFFDLKESTEQILASLKPTLRKYRHTLTVDLPEGIKMDSYPGPYGQVITNLFMNTLAHAFPEGEEGEIRIAARRIGEDSVEVTFADNGMGMTEEAQRRAFEPFFTTKRGRGGTGLGLHIVYNIVHHRFGGRITLESAGGKGTTFRIVMPVVTPMDNDDIEAVDPIAAASRKEMVNAHVQ